MKTIQRGTIDILRSAITGECLHLPEDFDFAAAYPELRAHQMDTLLFEGAVRCGVSRQLPIMQQLFRGYCAVLMKSETQLRHLDRITAAFEENGIDYMLLKGSRMKARYPKPELRNMSDADVLIRMEQYHKISPVMESLGFQQKSETDHELVWVADGLYLELHKRLIPSYNKDFYAYFGDGWNLALPASGHSYAMSAEDEFIYLFTHYAKHFRDGGIGCRHVVDLWVYLRANPAMDMERIRGELTKLYLDQFFENTLALLDAWFGDREVDDKLRCMTDFIFASGSYGKMDKHALSAALRDSDSTKGTDGKLHYVLSNAFPDVKTLEGKYTVLKKAPWMLPAVWVYRPFYKLLRERDDVRMHKAKLEQITTEGMTEHKKLLNYLGIDYHF